MTTEEGPKRKWWKVLMRWTLSIVLTSAVLLSIAFAYLYTNQEKLRGAVVNQLNGYLDAEMNVGDIQLDFFTQFPNVSIRFSEVFCKEVFPHTSQDTLFYFKNVYFEFNLWSLVQSNYELRGITLDEGNVKLRVYRTGRDNYHFWKASEDTANSPLNINLQDVTLSRTQVYFNDMGADFETSIFTDKLELSGSLTDGRFMSKLKLSGQIDFLENENINYLPNRRIAANLEFNTTGDSTLFKNGEVEIDGMNMSANGWIANNHSEWTLAGSELSLSQFITMVPEQFIPDKSLVDAKGKFNLDMNLHIGDKTTLINANTRVEQGAINLKKSGLQLSGMSFNASFNNGSKGLLSDAFLEVKNIVANTRTGQLKGELSIRNFASPSVATKGEISIGFEEALTLAETDFWETAAGTLAGTFDIRKRYKSFAEIQETGLQSAALKGSMSLKGGQLSVRNSGLNMQDLSAAMEFRGADISLGSLMFKTGSSDFNAHGEIKNAIVFGESPMPTFKLDLKSSNLVLEDIFAWELNHREESTDKGEPFRFDFNVNLNVERFAHRNFRAQNVSGNVYSLGRDIVGKKIQFEAVQGRFNSTFRWKPEGEVTQFSSSGVLTNVDIHELFEQFDNFGQASLTAENIYGKADMTYAMSIYFNADMEPVPASLETETDLRIREGRLVDYAPMNSLSHFAEMSELKDVQFATLENHVSISNQNIHFPGMTIKSNVVELWMEGDHSFENNIDYSLKLKLLDALGRRRKTNEELDEFIVESSREQPMIPVRIYGSLDNPSITLDRSLLSDGLQSEWKGQGQELRDLFEGKEDPTESEPEYIFEWNENPDTTGRR